MHTGTQAAGSDTVLQPEYQDAHCLSEVKCFSSRRLLSRFRSGCRGVRVDNVYPKTSFVMCCCPVLNTALFVTVPLLLPAVNSFHKALCADKLMLARMPARKTILFKPISIHFCY